MPISHQIKHENKLIITSWSGKITDKLIINTYKELTSRGDWEYSYNHIVDLISADMTEVTGEGLRSLAKIMRKENEDGIKVRSAAVSNKDLAEYLTNIYSAFLKGSNREIKFFRNISDAIEWINEDKRIRK